MSHGGQDADDACFDDNSRKKDRLVPSPGDPTHPRSLPGRSCPCHTDQRFIRHLLQRRSLNEALEHFPRRSEGRLPVPRPPCDLPAPGHQNSVTAAIHDEQRNEIISVSYDGFIRKWTVGASNSHVARKAHPSSIHCIVPDQELQAYLTGGAEGAVRAWKAEDLEELGSSETLRTSIECMALFSAKRTIFAGGFDGTIALFQVARQEQRVKFQRPKRIPGHQQSVTCLALDLYLKFLCSAGDDKLIKVWDVEGSEGLSLLRVLQGHAEPVRSLVVDEIRCGQEVMLLGWPHARQVAAAVRRSGGQRHGLDFEVDEGQGGEAAGKAGMTRLQAVEGEHLLHIPARICSMAVA
eukprot:768349-Hanusia_phi.AAC.4